MRREMIGSEEAYNDLKRKVRARILPGCAVLIYRNKYGNAFYLRKDDTLIHLVGFTRYRTDGTLEDVIEACRFYRFCVDMSKEEALNFVSGRFRQILEYPEKHMTPMGTLSPTAGNCFSGIVPA